MDEDYVSNRPYRIATYEWAKQFLEHYGNAGVESLASSYRNNQKCTWQLKNNGSFNSCHKVLFEDGTAWAVRFPIPGRVMHPYEKICREVAIMRFVKENTTIPVPKVIAFGTAADNHDPAIGPFLITDWAEGVPVTAFLERLPRPAWGPVLRDDIEETQLRTIYSQIASIFLELAKHDFDKIGALSADQNNAEISSWCAKSRPMTLRVNGIKAGGNVVADNHNLPAFKTTTGYMQNLVEQNIIHLYEQRNSIDDAADARRKFILRCRMRELVPYFVSADHDKGPFKLFCDDFRFGNILMDETTLKFTGVIDWEWAHTAPYQFLFYPPLWLILERPTTWRDQEREQYEEKLALFLECLKEEEDKRESETPTNIPSDQCMSSLMRKSYDDGTFWFMVLLQETFAFDEEVLWLNLEKVLRKRGLLEVGVPSERYVEESVEKKLKDLEKYNHDLQFLED
ncbi:hypothetical protein QM012_003613 [Aureobasidium pullulans]|uniref:Aminoglycoside phosphotransferase domain-containing protein n=1 Tax=Aureobasidium pullulans TaxID=5580 RepID=A0ABR0T8D3_AURPU